MLCPRQPTEGEMPGFNLLMELLRGDHWPRYPGAAQMGRIAKPRQKWDSKNWPIIHKPATVWQFFNMEIWWPEMEMMWIWKKLSNHINVTYFQQGLAVWNQLCGPPHRPWLCGINFCICSSAQPAVVVSLKIGPSVSLNSSAELFQVIFLTLTWVFPGFLIINLLHTYYY